MSTKSFAANDAEAWARVVINTVSEAESAGLAGTIAVEPAAGSTPAPGGPRSSASELDGPPHPGPVDDRYETMELLGQGGMGRVLAARDRQFGRIVALKELSAAVPTTVSLRRFVQESVVTANLEHPGIPAVYERGTRSGVPFYTMRRVEGRTLAHAIREARSVRERLKLLPVIERVAHTLGFAHERGVVHRDVKPDNVLLGAHGETVLLDWGIARVMAQDEPAQAAAREAIGANVASGATADGAVVGTLAYMAPEQARGEFARIGPRTDVFALGAMLYEVLTGAPPYAGNTAAALLVHALEGTRRPVREVAPEVPASLVAIVDRAMAMAPEERYATASEMAAALEEFRSESLFARESRALRIFTSAVGVGAFVVLLLGTTVVVRSVSSLREQGPGALMYLFCALAGAALSVIDWRTRGRYQLRGVAAALAVATALAGCAMSLSGLSHTFAGLARLGAPDAAARFRTLLTEGAWEALGSMASALVLCALQVVLLALTARALDRERAAAARRAPAAP